MAIDHEGPFLSCPLCASRLWWNPIYRILRYLLTIVPQSRDGGTEGTDARGEKPSEHPPRQT